MHVLSNLALPGNVNMHGFTWGVNLCNGVLYGLYFGDLKLWANL